MYFSSIQRNIDPLVQPVALYFSETSNWNLEIGSPMYISFMLWPYFEIRCHVSPFSFPPPLVWLYMEMISSVTVLTVIKMLNTKFPGRLIVTLCSSIVCFFNPWSAANVPFNLTGPCLVSLLWSQLGLNSFEPEWMEIFILHLHWIATPACNFKLWTGASKLLIFLLRYAIRVWRILYGCYIAEQTTVDQVQDIFW